jgi:ERCC4-type nuclease
MDNPRLIIDSREQTPFQFTQLVSAKGTLQSGDYSIQGLEHLFAVERKSLDDLAGSIGTERERFERELHRLRGFRFKRLLIIGSEDAIVNHRYRSQITPKAVLHSLYAIEARYDIPVIFAPTPEAGARLIERWAVWFAREVAKDAEFAVKAAGLSIGLGKGLPCAERLSLEK